MLTQAELKSFISYNPNTGAFIWRIDKPPKGKAGEPCGSYIKTTLRIFLNGHSYNATHLAYLYMTGNMPERIKFIDGDVTNLRFKNLELWHD